MGAAKRPIDSEESLLTDVRGVIHAKLNVQAQTPPPAEAAIETKVNLGRPRAFDALAA